MVRNMKGGIFFLCRKIRNMGILKFPEFYLQNCNYSEFWEAKSAVVL